MKRTLTQNIGLGLSAVLMGSLAIAGCSSAPSGEGESSSSAQLPSLAGRTLVSGIDATFPPFESVNDGGDFVGFGVDLGKEICNRVQCQIEFEAADWDGIFDRL
ncbi:MAG: transporter substrate-binding domain-containing protein, partial [Cyanobacteria bacterium J06639_1]